MAAQDHLLRLEERLSRAQQCAIHSTLQHLSCSRLLSGAELNSYRLEAPARLRKFGKLARRHRKVTSGKYVISCSLLVVIHMQALLEHGFVLTNI